MLDHPHTRPSPPGRAQWLTLAVVAIGVFVTTLDNSIVNVALPSIQDDLGLGLAGTAWVVNGYVLSFAVLLLTGGRLADVYGRRRLFLAGLAGFTAASLAAGLAPDAGTLIGARIVQGAGAALLTPPTLAIINHTFRDARARGTAIGIWGAVGALAFALGPVTGGLLTEHLHWSWVFFVNVPVGLAGLVAGRRVIAESRDPDAPRRLDVAGLGVSAAALAALTYALIEAGEEGWGSPVVLGLLGLAAAGGVTFVAVERRAAAPAVDLALFRIPAFSGAGVAILVFSLGTFGVFLYTSLYFQHVLGFAPVAAGAALLPWVVLLIVIAPFTGRLAERVGAHRLVAGGLVVMAAGLLLLTGVDAHSRYLDLLPGLVVGGLGGALTVPLNGVAVAAVPVERSGVASGVFNTARETGGSLGIAIIGAVVAGAGDHAFATGYGRGLTVAAGLALAAALVVLVTLREGASAGGAAVGASPALSAR